MAIKPDTTILNKYRIARLIATGGMARAWLAEESAFGNWTVAIFRSFTECWSRPCFALRSRVWCARRLNPTWPIRIGVCGMMFATVLRKEAQFCHLGNPSRPI